MLLLYAGSFDRLSLLYVRNNRNAHFCLIHTCMKAQRSSKFGQIRPPTASEKIAINLSWEKWCCHVSLLFSCLQVMRKCIRAWMSSNFDHIPRLTAELASKNRCCHFFMVAIDQIHFKFVGNEGMHNISDEFEFRPHRTNDYELSAFECLKYLLKRTSL